MVVVIDIDIGAGAVQSAAGSQQNAGTGDQIGQQGKHVGKFDGVGGGVNEGHNADAGADIHCAGNDADHSQFFNGRKHDNFSFLCNVHILASKWVCVKCAVYILQN